MLVGVRPCDARAVYLNGLPYSRDPYFQYRDSKTILVGFSCLEQCATCFCKAKILKSDTSDNLKAKKLIALLQRRLLELTCRPVPELRRMHLFMPHLLLF